MSLPVNPNPHPQVVISPSPTSQSQKVAKVVSILAKLQERDVVLNTLISSSEARAAATIAQVRDSTLNLSSI